MTVTTLKKISVKELMGLKRGDNGAEHMKKLLDAGHKNIFRIKGNVTGFGSKSTQYGESIVLTGQFLAQSLVDNKLYKASKAYMPKDFTETVIANFQNRGEANNSVEFTAQVSIVKDTSAGTGYTYIVEPIETEITRSWEENAMKEFSALPAPAAVKQLANGKK